MSPRNKEKERKDKAKYLKKQLSRYVSKRKAPQKDFKPPKVKKGLFQRGFTSNNVKRVKGPLNTNNFARLNGDLGKIISLVNGKQISVEHDGSKLRDKSTSKSKHQTSNDDSPPAKKRADLFSPVPTVANDWNSPDCGGGSKKFTSEKPKTPPVKKNIPVCSRRFENLPNTQDVRKARTAEFVNSLPLVYDENISAGNDENEPPGEKQKIKKMQMMQCFSEHISAISPVLLRLKETRCPKIKYNQALKDSLIQDHNNCEPMSDSSNSTRFSGTSSSFKSSLPAKSVQFKLSSHTVNSEPEVKSVPVPTPTSPLRLESPRLRDPFFGGKNLHRDSQTSSLPLTSQKFNWPKVNSQLSDSQRPAEFLVPPAPPQKRNSQALNSQLSDSQRLPAESLVPPAPRQKYNSQALNSQLPDSQRLSSESLVPPVPSQKYHSEPPNSQRSSSDFLVTPAPLQTYNSQLLNSQFLDYQQASSDFVLISVRKNHQPSRPSSQSSANFYDLNVENPSRHPQRERRPSGEMTEPPEPRLPPMPGFKYYAHNMF